MRIRVHVVFSSDGSEEERRVPRHVKPPRCGKASRKLRAPSWDRAKPLVHYFATLSAELLERPMVYIAQFDSFTIDFSERDRILQSISNPHLGLSGREFL